jgi:Trypsin-like peptidase domain
MRLLVSFTVSLLSILVVSGSSLAANVNMAEEDVKHLVVMIDVMLGAEPGRGAGIIVGTGDDSLYIATANHVVRRGDAEAQEINVEFKWLPGKRIKATLLPKFDSNLDLAVIRVQGLNELKVNVEALPFDRVVTPASLQRGNHVYFVGYRQGKHWWVNSSPESFAETAGDWLRFESRLIAGGNSGGALLDANRDVVGMVRSDEPPNGEALSITTVISKIKQWGYPVGLGQIDTTPLKFSTVDLVDGRICGITTSGTTYCWGRTGTQHDWGHGDETPLKIFTHYPKRVRGGLVFKKISVSENYVCALTDAGAAYCWGNGANGVMGNGSWANSLDPVPVNGGLTFKSIDTNRFVTCGVTTDDKIYCWGLNIEEPIFVKGSAGFRAVTARRWFPFGLAQNGMVYRMTFQGVPERPITETLLEVLDERYGIGKDGVIYDIEDDKFVKFEGPEGVSLKRVSGARDVCGIDKNGVIYCRTWLEGGYKWSPVVTPAGKMFTTVNAVGDKNGLVCSITTDSALYCWGNLRNYSGEGRGKDYGNAPVLITRN